MNKWLLVTLTCLSLKVDGHQEGRSPAEEPYPHLVHSSAITNKNSEKMTKGREKRTNDGSFGYSWNIGNGVSYMKMQVGKPKNPIGKDISSTAQHDAVHSLRDGGGPQVEDQNVNSGFKNVHDDFLKISQHVASQKDKNLSARTSTANQINLEKENRELDLNDKNLARYSFNNDQNEDIKAAHIKFHDLNTKYDNYNKNLQYSGWPQHQVHSFEKFNIAQSSRNEANLKDGYTPFSIENKPIAHDPGFWKVLGTPEPFYGNFGTLYQSQNLGVSNVFKGLDSDEKSPKVVNEDVKNPLSVNIQPNHSLGNEDGGFKHLGETNDKKENNEEQKIPNEFAPSQEEARSSQNYVSNHQSNYEEKEHKEGTIKIADEENVSGITYSPQIVKGEENINHQIANGFVNGHLHGMDPTMNQKLINDQVERIKLMQQKIIENYLPGAGMYNVLDGNTQNGYFNPGYPIQTEKNILLLQRNEYDRGSEPHNRLAYGLQNNLQVMNDNYPKDRQVLHDNKESLSYSNVRIGHSIDGSNMHKPYLNNNVQSSAFTQNQFFDEHKSVNEENTGISESQHGREETHWRPQRYSIKSMPQHQSDLQNDNFEFDKLKNKASDSDERKGREIKSEFENEGSDLPDHKEIHSIDEHTEHFHGNQEHEEAKAIHPGSEYTQFHQYPHQEPQVKVITKAVPVHKELRIPVPQMVKHPIMIPVPYRVLEPYPLHIPVPVAVEKKVEVPVEKVIHYRVEKPVPVKVVKEVKVPVPKPYPVKVPVYKIKYVHHNKKKNQE